MEKLHLNPLQQETVSSGENKVFASPGFAALNSEIKEYIGGRKLQLWEKILMISRSSSCVMKECYFINILALPYL
jgi:hypothetical protein